MIDREVHTISALDTDDTRVDTIWVAGPAALLVAKTHKIAERVGAQDRVRDKDALDVLRLLRAVETDDIAQRLQRLTDSDIAAAVTREARIHIEDLFGDVMLRAS
jgi:hypothetical protein